MMDFGKLVQDRGRDEAFRRDDGDVESEIDEAEQNLQRAWRTARNSLVAQGQGDDWAITATALTSQLWLVKKDKNGEWVARDVASIGDPAKIPLPVDISIASDAQVALGQHLHRRQDPALRPFQSGEARADL